MPRIVTTLHDPFALAVTCRQLGLAPPVERAVRLNREEVFGWVVRLPGLHGPLVCDTLTGLIAYDPRDNLHDRYVRAIDFIRRCYDSQFRLQQRSERRSKRKRHRAVPRVTRSAPVPQ
jgi:hypothetical protein